MELGFQRESAREIRRKRCARSSKQCRISIKGRLRTAWSDQLRPAGVYVRGGGEAERRAPITSVDIAVRRTGSPWPKPGHRGAGPRIASPAASAPRRSARGVRGRPAPRGRGRRARRRVRAARDHPATTSPRTRSRIFTAEHELRIVRAADAAVASGEEGPPARCCAGRVSRDCPGFVRISDDPADGWTIRTEACRDSAEIGRRAACWSCHRS
jgi:hypothetical protein